MRLSRHPLDPDRAEAPGPTSHGAGTDGPITGHQEEPMAPPRSARWSAVLVTAGAVAFLLAGIAGFLNAAVVNGTAFAEHLNDIRRSEAVRTEIGREVATAVVDAQPDLIAIRPAIEGAASAVVGSPILDVPFTAAVRSFHTAMTQEGASSAVLTLADLGATAATAVDAFVPQVAEYLPADLNLTLARVGGQEGPASTIIPLIQLVSTLAWVLPLLAILLFAGGLWLSPHRRLTLVRMGWLLAITGAVLGLGVLGMTVASWLVDDSTLTGAVTSAALAEFREPLLVRFLATVVMGGLLVAAAGALLPQVELDRHIRDALRAAARRPESPALATARGLGLVLLGTGMVLFPTLSAQVVAIVAGLVVFFLGVAEVDAIAERSRAADRSRALQGGGDGQPGPRRRGRVRAWWLVPVGAGLAVAAVVAALVVPQALPQGGVLDRVVDARRGCNGYEELCDRPFDQVVLAGSHNSMSVADGSGWFLAEQPKDMVSSLDDGIRALLVDTWYGQATASGGTITADRSMADAEAALMATYGEQVVASIRRTIDRVRGEQGEGPVEPYFCHTVCELGATRVLPEMQRLRAWLDAHPREVVVLFIQDAVTPQDTADVLTRAGIAELAHTHVEGQPWPTLQEMIDADQRVVVLMENRGGGSELPWLHQGFDLVQDTEYTFAAAQDFTCTRKRGRADSPLFAINHWLAGFTRLVSNAEQVNAHDVLRARVDACVAERGQLPSIIAVNWYDRGDLVRVVDELNGVAGRPALIG